MTPRYRCPWCGSFGRASAKDTRNHILKAHRGALLDGLSIIEAFPTRKTLDPPRNVSNEGTVTSSGVSGEGDS